MAGFRGGFGGGFGGGQMQQLMKQAQKAQQELEKAKEELYETEVEAESGNGLVQVVVNGKKEILNIKIDPKAVDLDDLEMLEDLIIAALNSAFEEVDNIIAENPLLSAGVV